MTTILLDDADTESEAWDKALELGRTMLTYMALSPDRWVILPPQRVSVRRGMTGKPWQILARRKEEDDGEVADSRNGTGTS